MASQWVRVTKKIFVWGHSRLVLQSVILLWDRKCQNRLGHKSISCHVVTIGLGHRGLFLLWSQRVVIFSGDIGTGHKRLDHIG